MFCCPAWQCSQCSDSSGEEERRLPATGLGRSPDLRLSWDSPAQISSSHTPLLLLITLHRNPNFASLTSDLSRCSGGDNVYYRPGVWGGSEAVMCPLDRTPLLGATVVGSLPATSHHGTHTPTATVRHGVMESFYWLIAASHQQTELW